MKYIVMTTTPGGNQRLSYAEKIREAGQIVAYCLADNTGMSRKEATQLAMQAEKAGHLESHGYTFTIEKRQAQ